jgi:hypothetical protein
MRDRTLTKIDMDATIQNATDRAEKLIDRAT